MRQRKQHTRASFTLCKMQVITHYADDALSTALASAFFYQPNSLSWSPEIFRLQVAKDAELKAIVSDPGFDLHAALRPVHELFRLFSQEYQ